METDLFMDKQDQNDGLSTRTQVFVDKNMNRRVFIKL